MATLLELRAEFTNSDLLEKIEAALIISVQDVLDGTPTADDQKYAAHVFNAPKAEARKALMSVLAKNKMATPAQIQTALDGTIQTNVDSVRATLSVAWNAAQA
jgi:hypothetical protein